MTTQTERIEVEAVLRLALEELENCADLLKAFEAPIDSCVGAAMLGAEKAATAIKEALMSLCDGAQPAVAKQHKQSTECGNPVANVVLREGSPTLLRESDIKPTDERLYTTPPQRTWVGLTKGEVYDLYDSDYVVFHQRIEAKLKEKNTK